MTTFILIPGAGGSALYWQRVVPLLERAGHQAVAVELPGDDVQAGLPEYAERVVRAIGTATDVVLVAQSLGGFTAAAVCARVPVRALVFVNAMIPVPGETASEWGDHVGSARTRTEAARQHGYPEQFELDTYFMHDVPEDIARSLMEHARPEVETVFAQPCPFEAWPAIPIHVIVGADDRLFPRALQARIARERLGKQTVEIPGGHLVALAHPEALTAQLLQVVSG